MRTSHRLSALLLALLLVAAQAPAWGLPRQVVEEPSPSSIFTKVFETLWNLFAPLGHELDPNGVPSPSGLTAPPGGPSDLGHTLDPNG
jgi:hypothetical protein